MNKLILLTLLLAISLAIHEIPMRHKPKTALESKRFLQYLRRSTLLEKAEKILSQIFPGKFSTGLYSYPEVKIFNYLDTEYYGYSFTNVAISPLARQVRTSELFSTLVHQTCGFHQRSADCLQHAICINSSMLTRAKLMFKMEQSLTSPTDQVQSLDSLVLTLWESED
jgi:hypothetical protein